MTAVKLDPWLCRKLAAEATYIPELRSHAAQLTAAADLATLLQSAGERVAELEADGERLTGYLNAKQEECAELQAALKKSQAERWKLTEERDGLHAKLAERRTLTKEQVHAVVREAINHEEVLAGHPAIETIAALAAKELAGAVVDQAQREADLREAFLAGIEHGDGWIDQAGREETSGKDEDVAAEYARSKVGG